MGIPHFTLEANQYIDGLVTKFSRPFNNEIILNYKCKLYLHQYIRTKSCGFDLEWTCRHEASPLQICAPNKIYLQTHFLYAMHLVQCMERERGRERESPKKVALVSQGISNHVETSGKLKAMELDSLIQFYSPYKYLLLICCLF